MTGILCLMCTVCPHVCLCRFLHNNRLKRIKEDMLSGLKSLVRLYVQILHAKFVNTLAWMVSGVRVGCIAGRAVCLSYTCKQRRPASRKHCEKNWDVCINEKQADDAKAKLPPPPPTKTNNRRVDRQVWRKSSDTVCRHWCRLVVCALSQPRI